MPNTGYKAWSTLEEYYTDDNTSTGITKLNSVDDPDYVAPVYDESACSLPLGNFELLPSYGMRFASMSGVSGLPTFSYPVAFNAIGITSGTPSGTLSIILDSVGGTLPSGVSLKLDLDINGALYSTTNVTSYGMTNYLSIPVTDSGTTINISINSI